MSAAMAAGLTGSLLVAPGPAHAADGSTVPNALGTPAPAASSGADAPPDAPPLADNYGPTPTQQQAMAAAVKQARTTRKAVVVTALTTPTTQIAARPDGTFALADNPLPVRTRQRGAWVPISTTLRRNRNGTYSAAATAYATVTFSGGGTGPLVTTTTGHDTYRLAWPTALPKPVVSGDTAVYRNVLPGVDLQVSANESGGFGEVFVVHDATAAANPALAKLTLAARSSGGLDPATATLAAGHGMTLQASSALAWDSNTVPAAAGSAPDERTAASDPSTARHPGLAAHSAALGVQATGRSLTLLPDRSLLRSPKTVWPVYLDPTYSWHSASGGTPAFDEVKQDAPCNHVAYYDNKTSSADFGQLGVGYVPSAYASTCEGIQRAFYQWKLPSVLGNAHINTATVGVNEIWQASWDCSQSHTVNLHWSGAIGSGTDWNNQPGYEGGTEHFDGSATVGAAYNADGCPKSTSSFGSFNVKSPIQTAATNHLSQITFALTNDGDESSKSITPFARYTDNPTLSIEYGHTPATPAASQLSASAGASNRVACASAAPYPMIGKAIASNNIVLSAAHMTSPDADPLQATFKYWVTSTPGTNFTGTSANSLANNATGSYTLPASFTNTLTNGTNVSWQVQTSNGEWASGWSPTCTFTAEPTAPDAPAIVANSDYPDLDADGVAGAAAGTPSVFQIAGATTGGTAARFYYNLDQAPATSGTPAGQIALPLGTTAGTPTHRYTLTDASGTTAADTGGAGPATLHTGATWAKDPTRQDVLALNGSTGYAQTTAADVTPSQSFTVSAWVKPATLGRYAVSQNGASYSSFQLGTTTAGAWTAALDANGTTTSSYTAATGGTAAVNVWAQVVASYTTGKALTLYVNGTQVGSTTVTTPPAQTGPLTLGADQAAGVMANYFSGDVSDVQTYASALTAAQVAAMFQTNNAALTVTPQSAGPHTLYVDAVDAAGDLSATASYTFQATGHAGTACASLAACFDDTAISPDTNRTLGNADGAGNSFSATDLTNAGWASGGKVTIDGASLTLPAFGSGQADNVLAANQTVAYNYPVPATGSSALMFLTTGTDAPFGNPGNIAGNTTAPYVPGGVGVAGTYCFTGTTPTGACAPEGTITYTDGTQQSYYLTVPDWVSGPASLAAAQFPHRNTTSAQAATVTKMYPFTVPLQPGLTVASVTLPDASASISDHAGAGLHVFAMGTRNTTSGTVEANGSTAATTGSNTWTGAWASDNEGPYDFVGANFSNQSFRVIVQPSATGSVIRVKLDNALGASALNIGHATVATTTSNDITTTAATSGTPVNLTFSGSASTKIPVGGMVFSDPLTFPVSAGQWLAVSWDLTNSVPSLVEHSWATDSFEFVSAIGSGDHTADTAGTSYTATGSKYGTFTDLVTGLDVQTAGMPTQVILGDNLIDAWQNNTAPLSPNNGAALRLNDDLAAASPTTPQPYGTVSAGIESNQISVDNPETNGSSGAVGGPAALSRIDRDVLDEPGISDVILDEGLEDALTGQTADRLDDAFTDLLTDLSYTETSPGGASFINTVAVSLTPCGTYAGSGSSGTGTNANDPCTTTVDDTRTSVNNYLSDGTDLGLNPFANPTWFYIDADSLIGVPNATTGIEQLAPLAMVALTRNNTPSDPINLTNAGLGALANGILAAEDTWSLDDGDANTTGSDYALNNYANAYLTATAPNAGNNTLTLNGAEGTDYTWPTATVGAQTGATVLGLNGTTGYGATGTSPVIDTGASFSISAWAELTALPTANATVAAESGTQSTGFNLQYNAVKKSWCLGFTTGDTAGAGAASQPCSTTAATAGTWYHLTGVYNARTRTAQLYVNGNLAATTTGLTTWSAASGLTLGAGQTDGVLGSFFGGELSDVQAWNYALSAPQVAALHDQIQ